MDDEEQFIRITADDIAEANRLSLSCPICASAVENNVNAPALAPVVCANCQTLYHAACWEQNGSKCAILGCGHRQARPYGVPAAARLVIRHADLPVHVPRAPVPNGRNQQLKEQEKRLQQERARRDFWNNLVQNILRAFGWRR
ncbi:MAG: hypothetical protein L0332_01620 [Chloroflexi bacterium]|nr:hypothetical protein [Chloroflexota bacterium]MCI0579539.1 hypothetical protein [Chloroflexota bacterium]MCI0644421.1 hypothetical protein [Chloroflexota bacterium]MCI0725414.1 hypothetical protein [Chloroflexota bacterium]